MGSRGTEIDDQSTADSTPEDVAVLYSWANLQGAKYRDYSASRREYRAQVRYRAAKALLERELKAQAEAESSAERAEREAFAAEAVALSQNEQNSQASRLESLRSAEAAARKAAAERVEAARRAESAAHATMLAVREEREIAEAHASAQEQAMIYTESEVRRRQLAGPQPRLPLGEPNAAASAPPNELQSEHRFPRPTVLDPGTEFAEAPSTGLDISRQKPLFADEAASAPMGWPLERRTSTETPHSKFETEHVGSMIEQTSPAWLYSSQTPPRTPVSQGIPPSAAVEGFGGESLQDSRERVAARWFALKGIFESSGQELPPVQPIRPDEVRTPLLAVFSLAGGVGKTSLVATLGRALSLKGEKVVLTDTTSHGLLPFYFGARELRPGVVRAFPPPAENSGEPISLVIYEAAGKSGDERQQELLTEEILRNGPGNHRLLLDLSSDSSWLVRQMVNLHPTVLVPIEPDMNSVISLQAVERLFRSIVDSEGRALLPFYVLNQFDAALPLHLDVREVFRRKLGDRLLRVAIRHSPAVSEALAEGMTVVDYAPASPVSQDYLDVASWLRSISPPATAEFRGLRWGER
jgi:cellulose synthase operon protein YhjQ